jgi:hypothetical protein
LLFLFSVQIGASGRERDQYFQDRHVNAELFGGEYEEEVATPLVEGASSRLAQWLLLRIIKLQSCEGCSRQDKTTNRKILAVSNDVRTALLPQNFRAVRHR